MWNNPIVDLNKSDISSSGHIYGFNLCFKTINIRVEYLRQYNCVQIIYIKYSYLK